MRHFVLIIALGLIAAGPVRAEEPTVSEAPADEETLLGETAENEASTFEPITQDISGRLDRLEKFMNNSALLDMLDVLEQLKLEVNELRGQIEVQNYNIEQLQKKQRDLYTDVDSRLQRLEKNDGSVATTTSPTALVAEEAEEQVETGAKNAAENGNEVAGNKTDTAATVDPVKAQAEYQRAFKLLKEQRYAQALDAFKQYLEDFPGSDYADNAQYWLAETNYVMQEYEQAIIEYRNLLDGYPDSQKVSHAMLKIGYSYAELGNTSDAEKTLNEVKSQYPGTTAARLANDRLRQLVTERESNT